MDDKYLSTGTFMILENRKEVQEEIGKKRKRQVV